MSDTPTYSTPIVQVPENFNHEIRQEIYADGRKTHTSGKLLTKDDVIKMEAYKDEGKRVAEWNGG
jgi:hypothetical protein